MVTDELMRDYDVVVVGGGAAGLSGGLTLARARRSVLVVDAGAPRNAPAAAVHGFLSRDGINPLDLLERGRDEVRRYGGQVASGTASAARRDGDGFAVTLADGRTVGARRLLITTGLIDELPDIPGLRERWGRDVVHCPYCHGWEVRDQAIGVLAISPWAVHQALLFRQWSADITLFLNTMPAPTDEEAEQLAARGITVVPGEIESLEIVDDALMGVRLRDGTVVPRQAVTVMPRFVARAGLLSTLGLQPSTHPLGVGEYIPAEPTGLTAVPGVWVAGNVTDLMAQVGGAASAGVLAAASINVDLILDDTRRAVTTYRGSATTHWSPDQHGSHHHHQEESAVTVAFDAEYWDARYRSQTALWSGNPNPYLVAEATALAPGSALDVGCGEGADAIWLAGRGWRVHALDIATVALERGARQAGRAGPQIADLISWRQADLLNWEPGPARYDLVSAQYMHLPERARGILYRQLADSVAVDGHLLIVGHHPSDMQTLMPRPQTPELFFTGDDLAALLDGGQWDIITNSAPGRTVTLPDGGPVTIHDAVFRARRRR